MSKNLIFVFRKPNTKDKEVLFCNNNIIFPLDNYARLSLEEDNITYSTLNDYFDKNEYSAHIDELYNLVQECGKYRFASDNQATLKDLLAYGDFSLWELCQQHLADVFFINFLFYKNIKKIISLEKPETIFILSNGRSDEEDIIKAVAMKEGISCRIYGPDTFSSIEYRYNYLFNYFLTRPHPFIDLLKNIPDSFIIIEKLQMLKERLMLFLQRRTQNASPANKSGKKKILALSFSNYHNFIKTTADIIKELSKDDIAILVRADVLSRDFKRFCNKSGLIFNSYYNYLSRALDVKIEIALNILLNRMRTIKINSLSEHFEGIVGFSINNIFKRFFKANFSRYGLLRLIRFKLIVGAILDKEKPSLIMIQEDRSKFGRIITTEARKRKIPCLVILQHITNYDSFYSFLLGIPSFADITAVTTNKVKNLLISRGMDAEKIVAVGNPVYGAIIKKGFNFVPRKDIYSRLRIGQDRDVLLFASQPVPQSDVLHRALIKMMGNFPNKHLIIKLHPVESGVRSALKSKASRLKNITVVQDIDTWSLINYCKILITISSITAAEAMILKKPVIMFGLNFDIGAIPFIEHKSVYFVDRYKDLPSAINLISDDSVLRERLIENADRFVQENLGLHDGQVNKRIIDLINRLILK